MSDSLLSTSAGLIAVVVLVAINGFFVAAEFALITVRRTRVDQMIEEGRAGARAVRFAQDHVDTFIAACQLGITMASLGLGFIGEPALAGLIEPAIEVPLGNLAPAAAQTVAVVVAFALITTLLVVTGELAPKAIALASPERTALLVTPPTNWFSSAFRPVIWLLNTAGWVVLKPFGIRPTVEHAQVTSIEELKLIVMASYEAGLLGEDEQRMVSRVVALSSLNARQVMVPRTEVVALDIRATLDDVLAVVERHTHTRIPVFDGSIDNVVGVVNVKNLLPLLQHRERRFPGLRSLMKPPLNVPETMKVDDLLSQMRRRRLQMAIVIDEFGGTAGVVTIEDILERIVGEVQSELEPAELPQVEERPDGSALLDGLMLVTDVAEQFALDLEGEGYDTIGGYLFGRIGRRPAQGDEIELTGGRTLRVAQLDGLRIARVLLSAPRTEGVREA